MPALRWTTPSPPPKPSPLPFNALLDKFGGTTGSLTGQYTPRAVQLALYPTGTSTVNDAPLTRMYISEEETLYDAGQLYNKLRSTVVPSIRWQACCCRAGRWAATSLRTSWLPCWG